MRKRSTQILDNLLSASEFQAMGEDEQGVPRYRSSYKGVPPRYACWVSISGGILLLTLGILAAIGFQKANYILWLGLLCCIGGLGAIGSGVWLWNIRMRFAPLTSQEQACSQLGISQRELKELAFSKGVKPSCNINGNDYYNLADFDDAASLLRASGKPTAQPETLLRPAEYNTETPSEQLLRVPGDTSRTE